MGRLSAKDRVEALLPVLREARPERYVYLIVCVICLLALLFLVSLIAYRNALDIPKLLSLFGPAGVISVSMKQVLRIWSDSISYLKHGSSKEKTK